MDLTIEYSEVIAQGSVPQIIQDEDGLVHLFYVPNGAQQIHHTTSEVELGLWEGLTFGAISPIAPDEGIKNLGTVYLPEGKFWFTWQTEETHRYAVTPDDGPQYQLDTPYRLFYAVDTEKLYMNISETWQFIGSPNIDQLVGYGDLIQYIDSKYVPPYDDTVLTNRVTALEDDVAAIQPYDDTALQQAVTDIEARVEKLETSGTPYLFTQRELRDFNQSWENSVGKDTTSTFAISFVAKGEAIIDVATWIQEVEPGQLEYVITTDDGTGYPDYSNKLYSSPLFTPIGEGKVTHMVSQSPALTAGTTYWLMIDGTNATAGTFALGKSDVGTELKYTNDMGASWTDFTSIIAIDINFGITQ